MDRETSYYRTGAKNFASYKIKVSVYSGFSFWEKESGNNSK